MKSSNQKLDMLDWASVGLAALTALAGAVRVFGSDAQFERIDGTTLTYFGVAGALLLLRKVKSLSFGDYKLELKDIEAKADEALEEAKTATSMAQHVATAAPPELPVPAAPDSRLLNAAEANKPQPESGGKIADPWDREPGSATGDPWKGQFGGKPEAYHRQLRAEVVPVLNDEGWYRIRLWVESTDQREHPLKDRVRFFIHTTFAEYKPYVRVVAGIAELRLKAWGAFTVGALADDGQTELELDLSEDASFPRPFRER